MALINLRNALMAGKRLPYDAEVEYLESTGKQWIDTGILPAIPCHIKSRVSFANTNVYQGGVSCGWGDNNTHFAAPMMFANGMPYCAAPGIGWKPFNIGYVANGILDTEMVLDVSGEGYCSINGTSISVSGWKVTTTITEPILLGAIGHWIDNFDKWSFLMINGGRLYSAEITCGNNRANFIPVRVGTVGYMYDRVSRKLFGNQGTGDFVLGPDKS